MPEYKAYIVTVNQAGYMPDMEPYPCESLEHAKDCLNHAIANEIDWESEEKTSNANRVIAQFKDLIEAVKKHKKGDFQAIVNGLAFSITLDTVEPEYLKMMDCDLEDYEVQSC